MKKAFIFTGQGNEYLGMGKELYENSEYARNIIDKLDFGYNFKEICVEENDLIHNTLYSQSSIFVLSIILANLLKEKGLVPDAVAGLSLGEYTAMCYSGILSIEDTNSLITKRAKIMSEALENSDSGMTAIMFYDKEKVKDNLINCEIANYNSYNQIVITGIKKHIEETALKCTDDGAKCIPLNVTGAFHSSLLKEASTKLYDELIKYDYKNAEIPIYYNYTGNKTESDIKELLVKQLYNPVKFIDIIENMLNDGVEEFYVVGIGNAPRSFIKNIADKYGKKVKIKCIEHLKDVNEVIV